MKMMTLYCAVVAIATFLAPAEAQFEGATPVDDKNLVAGFNDIRAKDCRRWLSKLASDEFEGRGTGQPGYQKAADFVAAHLKKWGIEPANGQSYFQNMPFARYRTHPKKSSITAGNLRLKGGEDFSFGASSGKVAGDVVFVTVRSRDATMADPAAIKNKIVVLSSRSFQMRRRIQKASPKAMIVVSRRIRRMRKGWSIQSGGPRGGGIPTAVISRSTARRLAKALGVPAETIDTSTITDDEVHLTPARRRLTMNLAADVKTIGVPNVCGKITGSDPKLADEVVIMGAHLDHLGKRGDTVYNGADDDGSGSTGLLAIARAFSKNPVKPKRSLLFLWFCGEEMGLLGSNYYSEHPLFPIEKSVCELQMDMIGRNEEKRGDKPEDNLDTIHLVGSKRLSMALHNLILKMNAHINYKFEYDEEDVYSRSDHYNFAKKGIPIAFFFTGFHPDYHRPTDDVEKISFNKIVSTARLVYLTAFTAANADHRLVVDKGPLKDITAPKKRKF